MYIYRTVAGLPFSVQYNFLLIWLKKNGRRAFQVGMSRKSATTQARSRPRSSSSARRVTRHSTRGIRSGVRKQKQRQPFIRQEAERLGIDESVVEVLRRQGDRGGLCILGCLTVTHRRSRTPSKRLQLPFLWDSFQIADGQRSQPKSIG